MNNAKRVLLAVYLPLTILFLVLDNLYPDHPIVNYIKYTAMISLFLSSLVIRKTHNEQRIISLALFFIVAADFFSVFFVTIPQIADKVMPLGIAGFMVSYLLLILVYQKNFRFTKKEAVAFFIIFGSYVPVFLKLAPYVTGPLFIGTSVFGLVLCWMTWTSVCTLFRGYYNAGASRLIALSGSLIFISDIAVVNALFNPAYSDAFIPWLKNIIWASYVPAWCLQVMLTADEKLLISPYTSRRYMN